MPNTDEWNAATAAAHNELACAYANGQLEVPQPIDESLWALAKKVASSAVRASLHMQGTDGFYEIQVPIEHRSESAPRVIGWDLDTGKVYYETGY